MDIEADIIRLENEQRRAGENIRLYPLPLNAVMAPGMSSAP